MILCWLWKKIWMQRNSAYPAYLALFICIFGTLHTVSFAKSRSIKDYYNRVYEKCIEREGGVRNGSIATCTNIVTSEILVKIEDRVQAMIHSDNNYIEISDEQVKSYDQERKESFVLAIDDFQESTIQVCRFLGYHVGGPADPICTMNMMVDLLGILERWD